MRPTRRSFLSMLGGAALADFGASTGLAASAAQDLGLPVSVAARVPWMVNQVALTSKNVMFLGLPRYPDHEETPCVARVDKGGTPHPFPGNGWNEWKRGDDGLQAFVYVNSVHIFADDTVWCVDQGTLRLDAGPMKETPPAPGAQKIVQFDSSSGAVLRILRFAPEIVPPGAQINDLRIKGSDVYLTDSGLGALIYHNLSTGKTIRRFSGLPPMMAAPVATAPPKSGSSPTRHRIPKADQIELSPDGEMLYWSAPTGPFRRIPTADFRDANKSDEELLKLIEKVADIQLIGGSSMDSLGNLYLSELSNRRITVLSPTGKTAVLASSSDLMGPDNSFIGVDRRLYVPNSQAGRTRLFGNATDLTQQPFLVISIQLPRMLDGISLGNSLNLEQG